jgi:hypothetical protein
VILVAVVLIAMASFWILARSLGRLTVEPDPDECEMDADNFPVPELSCSSGVEEAL